MLKKKRFDGTLIRNLPSFTVLMPYIMPDKKGSTIYFEQELDVTAATAFIKEFNREFIREREILTLFELVICAAVRAIALRPKVNRFISGHRYYQRNQIVFNFVAKKEISDEGQEVNVKIPFSPHETLATSARKVRRYIRAATSGDGLENESVVDTLAKLPGPILMFLIRGMDWLDQHNLMLRSFIESDPMWCSVFLTNVGSLGLDAPFHHLFERGNCPIFLSVGRVKTLRVLDESGAAVERKILLLRYAYDDRVVEGVYMAKALGLIKSFVEDPKSLVEPPALTAHLLEELALSEMPEIDNGGVGAPPYSPRREARDTRP